MPASRLPSSALHLLPAWLAAVLLLIAVAAPAHEGEDHGAPAAPAPAGPAVVADPAAAAAGASAEAMTASVRATAASELFEVVAVLAGGHLQVFLDRYDSNAPVTGAQVAVEGTGISGRAGETSPGLYALPAASLAPGAHGLTISVETATDADLLLLTLDVPAAVGQQDDAALPGWRSAALAALAVALAAIAMAFAAWRRRARPAGVRA